MRSAPQHLHTQVVARINRREQARRAIVGVLALTLGAMAIAMLTLAPLTLGLLENLGVAPTLLIGGVETFVQLLTLLDAMTRMLFVLVDQFTVPIIALVVGSLAVTLTLNGLWIIAVRRLRAAG
jgi:hypothetical protein